MHDGHRADQYGGPGGRVVTPVTSYVTPVAVISVAVM